jgi:hypothetical protein
MNQDPNFQPLKPQDDRLKAAIAGQYSFSIKKIFDEAWLKTMGFKAVYWEAMGIAVLIGLGLLIIGALIFMVVGVLSGQVSGDWHSLSTLQELAPDDSHPLSLGMKVLMYVLVYAGLFVILPLLAGLWMIGLLHVSDRSIRVGMVLKYYKKPWRYGVADIWANFFVQDLPTFLAGTGMKFLTATIGTVAYWLCVPAAFAIGIYAYISYFFTIPLLADKELTTWGALESSRKAIGFRWFDVCRAVLVISLVTIVIPVLVIAMLASTVHPLMLIMAILLIWLIPFCALCTAILYREIFGVTTKA